MKLKRFALRGLIILAVVVALCMFFARTVQTITTPKVRLYSATKGRLEQSYKLTAEVYFPETEEITVEDAQKTNVTVSKVSVKVGSYVQKGDAIFTTTVSTYEEELEKLQESYDSKASELLELDVTNRKLSKESRQNELYSDMQDKQSDLTKKTYEARKIAMQNGISLGTDLSNWKKQLAAAKDVPQEVTDAVNKALAAQSAYEEASTAFYATYEDKKLRVSSDTFDYIKKRNTLQEEMDEISDQMLELDTRVASMATITAPHDGWIVSVNVSAGDTYDGSKAAYTMTAEGSTPSLKASLAGVERSFSDGTKVTIGDSDSGTEKTTVTATRTDSNGDKYLVIEMPESMQKAGSSSLRQAISNGVQATITYRAKESTTLLPASAVRSDGTNYYVYVVQDSNGSFLSSNGMKAVKTSVTVIEKNDKQYSVQEDFSYQQIAYQEDRALSDNMSVMEYVN
jgi:multidrug efflux pump subunit AcrA (membrane-fusion protein)